jgi:hypothetical protein
MALSSAMTSSTGDEPVEKSCDVCGADAELTQSTAGGVTKNAWFCPSCIAFVCCHEGTTTPLGHMALPAVRQLRKQLHEVADPLWREGLMTRDRMYLIMASKLEIDPENAHIAMLSEDQLRTAISFFIVYREEQTKYLIRRKEKRNAKRQKREQYDEWG